MVTPPALSLSDDSSSDMMSNKVAVRADNFALSNLCHDTL